MVLADNDPSNVGSVDSFVSQKEIILMIDVTPDMHYSALDAGELLVHEWRQQFESGHDVDGLEASVREALSAPEKISLDDEIFDKLERAPMKDGWEHEDEGFPQGASITASPDDLHARIRGAWYGRCAGCLLGKPVEGWTHPQIEDYLERAGIEDISNYLPRLEATDAQPAFNAIGDQGTFLGEIDGMARDDDIDYTIAALILAERHGMDFATSDVANLWLEVFPFMQVFTAERAAMRNLIRGHAGETVATWRNPYKEWIGALIRADFWGYVHPGNPFRAAQLAERDARLSHTDNGIGGARWAAALVASALVSLNIGDVVATARTVINDRSRLAAALDDVSAQHAAGLSFQQVRDHIVASYGGLNPVHTINNAAFIQAALLWGDGDFTRSIGLVVRSGWDTDSNGATVGSVVGALNGFSALDERWTGPLLGPIKTAIFIEPVSTIDSLVGRTIAQLSTSIH